MGSATRFLALYERVRSDALRVNIDVTSLYDYWDLWEPSETVRQTCTALVGHYGLGHVKEVALAEGFHIHAGLAPPGTGVTDWAEVLRLMAPHLPEDSWAILEHVQTPEEGRASLAYLRAAARRPTSRWPEWGSTEQITPVGPDVPPENAAVLFETAASSVCNDYVLVLEAQRP